MYLLVVGIIISTWAVLHHLLRPKYKFHEGPAWQRFLGAYTVLETKLFAAASTGDRYESKLLHSRFGSTQVHLFGNETGRPVFLFHGMGTSSLLFGQWIIQPLVQKKYYVIAVDILGDVGKSLPKDGDVKSIPSTGEEWTEWFLDIKKQLDIDEKRAVDLVGYSYGCFLASQIALEVEKTTTATTSTIPTSDASGFASAVIRKLIFIAPAGVFSHIESEWLKRAILCFTLGSLAPTESIKLSFMYSFLRYMQPDFDNDRKTWSEEYTEYQVASSGVSSVLKMKPDELGVEDLKRLAMNYAMLLIIGEKETVTNPQKSIERAREVGAKTKICDGAGHVLYDGRCRAEVKDEVVSFLDG